MPAATFGLPTAPRIGDALVWNGRAFEPGSLAQAASAITGLTLNRVPFGNALGGLQDSASLTWDGTTFTVGAIAASSLKASSLTSGRVAFASTAGLLADSAALTWNGTTFATSGLVSVTNATDASDSATAALAVVGGVTMAKNLWVGSNALAGVSATLNCADASGGYFKFTSANVLRWQFGRVGSTSAFQLSGYDSSGNLTDIPFEIANAAAGTATWTRPNIFPAATTAIPSIRLPHGTAPSSPTNGDMWTTTAGLFVRVNGSTIGPLT